MKTQINDLLLKMQAGENCIGETANHLLNLFDKQKPMNELPEWLQKLWQINPTLARQAETDYMGLKKQLSSTCFELGKRLK